MEVGADAAAEAERQLGRSVLLHSLDQMDRRGSGLRYLLSAWEDRIRR